jgi:hypothetical protein
VFYALDDFTVRVFQGLLQVFPRSDEVEVDYFLPYPVFMVLWLKLSKLSPQARSEEN